MKRNTAKLESLILLLASHPSVNSLGKTKLYKLLYFIDVTHLREHGSTITGYQYIKMPYGPVPDSADLAIQRLERQQAIEGKRVTVSPDRSYRVLHGLKQPNSRLFSKSETDAINEVIACYGQKSAEHLSDLSHLEPAWDQAKLKEKMSQSLMFYGASEDPDGL